MKPVNRRLSRSGLLPRGGGRVFASLARAARAWQDAPEAIQQLPQLDEGSDLIIKSVRQNIPIPTEENSVPRLIENSAKARAGCTWSPGWRRRIEGLPANVVDPGFNPGVGVALTDNVVLLPVVVIGTQIAGYDLEGMP